MKEIKLEGAMTVDRIPQLNINRLRRGHYLIEGDKSEGVFQSSSDEPVFYINSDCTTTERKLNIKYEVVNGSEMMEYEIKIVALKSNLGKGVDLYFICPVSQKRAKVLYYCIKTHIFIHRTAYHKRLHYTVNSYGKLNRLFANSKSNEQKLFKCFLQMKKQMYKGEDTKISLRIAKLTERRVLLDRLICEWLIKRK